MTCLAMGAATVPPKPPIERSTVTATATRGWFAGAKAMNQGWVRFELGTIWAVPVLPATSMPWSAAAVPVPSLTTCVIIWPTSWAV